MNKIIVVILFLFSFNLLAKTDVEKRRAQIVNIINEELDEVRRLSKQSGGRNPSLMLRMAELNLEKARLFREKENKNYLSIPAKKRSKVNKKSYFSNSSKFFKKANSLALKITRSFKNYSRIGEVYYILGYNAKEANKQKTATRYLRLATKKSKDPQTKTKTQISLAEIYYNNKKYRKAIPLYEKALAKHKDKWWTKDSFNLAWCYFRANKYSNAINKMKEIFKASYSAKYIDMRPQIERDIGLFYATSDRIDEGIKFYQKIGINFTDQLMRIAMNLIVQGKYSRANKVLNHASHYEKSRKKLVEINIEKLNLYLKFGKYSLHHKTSDKLFLSFKKNNLTKNQVTTFSFQLEKVAATLQRQVISKTYRRLKKQRNLKAKQAIAYFEMLGVIDSKRSTEFKYLKAETAFATKMYSNSYDFYKETFLVSEQKKEFTFRDKSMNGMLSVLSHLKNNRSKNIFVFEAYLRNWPNKKKAKDIYGRLFNNYMAGKDYKSAENLLNRFVRYYPKDKTQEAMIAKLMDVSRKNKDNNKIRAWVSAIDAGNYRVSAKYKRKLQELLTAMQIENVQDQLAKGNKKVALVGYLDILKDKFSTKRSKINAKYNLAALYYELGDSKNSYKWAVSAMNEMSKKDVLKFSGSFITISNYLFTSLEFEKSADLSRLFLSRICKLKSKKKRMAYKNGIFIYLANGNVAAAEKMASTANKCKIPKSSREEIEYEIMREYFNKKNWNRYEFYALKVRSSSRYYAKVIDDFLNLINIHRKFNNTDKVNYFRSIIKKLYYKAKKKRKIISLRSLDYFASINIKKMEATSKKISLFRLAFPEKVFQKSVESKIKFLDKLVEQGNDVLEVGSGVGIVNSYKILFETYKSVGEELSTFTPPGKSKEYIQGFKKQFQQISKQMISAANRYKKEAIRAIKKNSILSQNNFFFQNNKFPIKYFGDESIILMDRGGK